MKLIDLNTGEQAVIVKVLGHGAFRKRVIEMGFVRGKVVKVELNAPMHDPIKYTIMGYQVSLRRKEAELIEVVRLNDTEAKELKVDHTNVITDNDVVLNAVHQQEHTINIALIGNPNCGKTSLFNFASGGHEHVGNYSGVTVEAKEGFFEYKGYHFKAVDLPGTYSLSTYSPEELYVRRYLKDEIPDVIVNVVVASNLERNLFLSTELIDMDRSMVIALNMYDELRSSGAKFDYEELGKMIGVPIVPTVTKTGEGLDELFDAIIKVYEDRHEVVRHVHVHLGGEMEDAIKEIKDSIKASSTQPVMQFSPRYLAIKLLEHDKEVEELLSSQPDFKKWLALRDKWASHIEDVTGEDVPALVASEKYGFISGALRETFEPGDMPRNVKNTDIVDALVTHKLFGFPLFLLMMWFMFWCTFQLGSYPMEWIQSGVDFLSETIQRFMPAGPFKDLIVDGVIGGVGTVIVFLPNILLLYFFISFMEDSGYMSRAAFIMDKMMHKLGIHGKSFIPLVMGFGCNVPAIMGTRIIESQSSRLITILINPFMSCSARLPIYLLFVGIFFPSQSAWVLLGLYLTGVLVAVITARLLRKFYFHADETPFVMELPPYRVPTLKATLHHMWDKGAQYLKKMGGVILLGSIIVWGLNYFPRDFSKSNEEMTAHERTVQQENSYLAQFGKTISPVMEPLGFNWKSTVAFLSGIPAKEIVVSTLGVLYSDGNEDGLSEQLTKVNPNTGKPDFTRLQAFCFMLFVLLYMPCLASIVAVAREAGSWKYGAFTILYNTGVAWLITFLVFQIGSLII